MKQIKLLFLLIITIFTWNFTAFAHDKDAEHIYIFGFSASFNDSLVYVTDIQRLDSVHLEPKTKFLKSRAAYSNQLEFYLSDQMNRPNTTCAVFFDKEKKSLEKKYNKILKRYKEDSQAIIKILTQEEFCFKPEINQIISE